MSTNGTPNGIVNAHANGITMLPGYEDPDGDFIDGPDGNDDIIYTKNGDNTVDAGSGNDVVVGGTGNDTIIGGTGNDTLFGGKGTGDDLLQGGEGDDVFVAFEKGEDTMEGGAGRDTYFAGGGTGGTNATGGTDGTSASDASHGFGSVSTNGTGGTHGSGASFGTKGIDVTVNDDGDGSVFKQESCDTDTVMSVENFIAPESSKGIDSITLTTGVTKGDVPTAIQGLDDSSEGTLTLPGGTVIAFGPDEDYKLSNLLNGTSPGGGFPAVGPIGSYSITHGDEDGQVGNISFENFETINFTVIPCFTPGTLIGTARGEVPVEMLREGDRIVTRDNGMQEIRWVGHKTVDRRRLIASPEMQPVLIRKGALGNGLPERDMLVSPNHRLLIANDQSALYFDDREVLAAAKHLVNGKSICQVQATGVTYVHFMFDHHEVVLSDGAWTESFQPGDYSLKGIGGGQRDEILSLFPGLRDREGLVAYGAARSTLKRHEAELLTF